MKTAVKIDPKKIDLYKKRLKDKGYMEKAINEIASEIVKEFVD